MRVSGRLPHRRRERAGRIAGLVLAIASLAALHAGPARAVEGYELDSAEPFHELDGLPRGLAVDQATQDLYVAISSTNPLLGTPGQIERFDSSLALDEIFAEAGGYYTGVAVNPLTHDFYGLQVELRTDFGNFGTSKVDRFSSAGAALGSFAVTYPYAFPPIAIDSSGRIFYPNNEADSVQVFSPDGTLVEAITCGGCPGGALGVPVGVAIDAGDNLYIVDLNPDRVLKMKSSEGGPYVLDTVLQSGLRAGAVAVDSVSGDVLIGNLPSEHDYHIVAYDSTGVPFDDFGVGLFPDPPPEVGAAGAYQIAVNETTHELFVGNTDKFVVFERTEIGPPTVTLQAATNVGQLGATLHAVINPGGHATLACEFEYVSDDEFQINGFTNATALPCAKLPDGYADTALSAAVSGLVPGTTYHVRVAAASNGGSEGSSPMTFETLPAVPPAVETQAPSGIGESFATLRGVVDPLGGVVSACHFEYGTSETYGSSIPCFPFPQGEAAETVSAQLSGLAHAALHHYRLVVSTNAGTSSGGDVAFATASPPGPDLPPDPDPEPSQTLAPTLDPAPVVAPRRCRKGFRRQRVKGRVRCVKICGKGFRRTRVRGKVRCVRVRRCRQAARRGKAHRKRKCARRKPPRSHRHHRRKAAR